MPRCPEVRAAVHIASLLLAGALAARPAAAASESLPIQIDGAFADWNGAAATDPAGDPGTSGVDFTSLWIANDVVRLFIRFDTGVEIEPDEGHDVRVLLDTDDNAFTGVAAFGVGAELIWSLGQRSGSTYLGGGSQATSHAALGLVIGPTVSATQFELGIRRDATGSGGAPLFAGPAVRVVIADFGPGGDAIGAGTVYTFDPAPQPVPAIALGRADPSHVRVASYNIENDGLFDTSPARQAALGRMLGAIDADVWILNEVWNHNGPEVQVRFQQLLPAGPGAAWTAVNPLQGTVIVSRLPVIEWGLFPVDTRDWVAARLDPRPKLDTDLVVLGNHLKAFSGASNDATRQDQADGLIRYLADMRAGTRLNVAPQTPIVAGGDMNLVGVRAPLETIESGDIVDEGQWGADSPPDWDGSAFDAVPARHPDERVVHTWRDDFGTWYPGRLDWIFHTGSVLELGHHFVLDTRGMTPGSLAAHGLLAGDTETASDHAPVVADFAAAGVAGVPRGVPATLVLAPPSPNPFRDAARLAFALPREAAVTARVHDAAGRVVRTLADGAVFGAGPHLLVWDGVAADGRPAGPGLYFISLHAGAERAARRVVRLR